ncbi:response regulator transcription factor [Mucilaginibacter sp. FT3.2]|uniref:response regulator transcription factor n=1 Tax=Mucilaginibacter sp. FT3.2 TaxID=2723090 RepID=UPI0016136830|nr:response regulator transcription factor [Mucilaginibacter sp. FT3.2]MBB6230358.1 DNA-binding response OmpR family regulator [Mucilaginibacter sp. FT3.2]
MSKICLVEDEEKVAAFISKGLQEHDFEVSHANDGFSAIDLIAAQTFDLIILDLMLPDINGVDLCRRIRKENSQVPILMLTALDRVDDKVNGLQAGADDYLVKPFHFNELLARISALLRRYRPENNKEDGLLTFSDLKLNTFTKAAERANAEIGLTTKEYHLLELFMRNPNKTLSRDYIAEKVWDIQFDTGTNFIDVYVNYLRKKIEKGAQAKLIHTVIGMGYILKEK